MKWMRYLLPVRLLIDLPTSRKLMMLSNGRSAEDKSDIIVSVPRGCIQKWVEEK